MDISFSIGNNVGENLVSASRWQIPDREDLNDNRIVNKLLKTYIGSVIDAHAKYQIVNEDETALADLRAQSRAINQQEFELRNQLEVKKQTVVAAIPPTDMGPE